MAQKQLIFFWEGEAPSAETRKAMVDPFNPACPFSQFVGNDKAVQRLGRSLFSALGRRNHVCADQSFALLGPASTGKTTLVKMFAQILQLPLVEIGPKSVKNTNDILAKVAEILESTPVPGGGSLALVPMRIPGQGDNVIILPPCVIFIDEVHALNNNIVQALLKATEKNDGMLDTGKYMVNCKNVCWVIATTDRGQLFDAFDTRFTKIFLELYSSSEIAQIIRKRNPDWTMEVCQQVAKYVGHVPREALAFAVDMRIEAEMFPGEWSEVARRVAEDNGIDEHGMTEQRVLILKALGQGAMSKQRLASTAACKIEELEKFIMPPLVARTSDSEPLVGVTSKGYGITAAGLAQLDLRGIEHLGDAAVEGSIRRKGSSL